MTFLQAPVKRNSRKTNSQMKIYVEKTNEFSIPVLPSSRQATVMSRSFANWVKLLKKTLLAQLG